MRIHGDASRTMFAVGKIKIQNIPLHGGIIYQRWHDVIQSMVDSGQLSLVQATGDGQMLLFDWQSFHCGAPATKDGWRFFIRATINTHRKPQNEIRKQVQIYMSSLTSGW
jgi:hypothetical protein